MLIQISEQGKAKGYRKSFAKGKAPFSPGFSAAVLKGGKKLFNSAVNSAVNSALNQAGVGNWTSSLGKWTKWYWMKKKNPNQDDYDLLL